MISELLLPFQFAFMDNAFLIMTIMAVPTSLLSCFLVLKGWSLMVVPSAMPFYRAS